MSSEDFWLLARIRRRSRFENPVTEPKRSQKPKRPLSIGFQLIAYSFDGNALQSLYQNRLLKKKRGRTLLRPLENKH
jgi:hypothetical protein